jgi:hypothetical protein
LNVPSQIEKTESLSKTGSCLVQKSSTPKRNTSGSLNTVDNKSMVPLGKLANSFYRQSTLGSYVEKEVNMRNVYSDERNTGKLRGETERSGMNTWGS